MVVPKYNPARTVTPEGAVGLGGAYMCIYPMESPGGYQLIGRTLPIWNTFGRVGPFTPAKPWLLRYFDQVRPMPQATMLHIVPADVVWQRQLLQRTVADSYPHDWVSCTSTLKTHLGTHYSLPLQQVVLQVHWPGILQSAQAVRG